MRSPSPLHTVFLGLLAGCGLGPGTSTTDETLGSGGCNGNTYEEDYEVPLSQVEPVVDDAGMVLPEECYSLCANNGAWGDVLSCTLLDDVMPAATSGNATTAGDEATTTAAGDGSTSGGDGTGGGDAGGSGTAGGTGGGDTGGESSASTGAAETAGESTGSTMATTGAEQTVTLRCEFTEYCLGGRGHEALRSRPRPSGEDRLGRWLAATAHSEAASVIAFLAMADELVAHGAPEDLVQRARAAAADEVEHARAMTRLALARGATVQAPRFDAIEIRDLTTIATENAAEGCVRETWAALEAAHQARAAADPELRRAMARIAADETRHAELSHDLDAWLRTQLDDEAVARVDAARRRAVRELLDGMHGERDRELCEAAGLPAAATARRLCEGLQQQLWA